MTAMLPAYLWSCYQPFAYDNAKAKAAANVFGGSVDGPLEGKLKNAKPCSK